jgi:GNAT superfamily N-acetyltransferase
MITLRSATPHDAEAIASLLTEIDRFYGATHDEPVPAWMPAIQHELFGERPASYLLLAWDDARLVGLASYSYLWPAAGVTRSLHLKELFVTEDCRGTGLGQDLMRELCRIAIDAGCSRAEWTADTDNPIAQRFYAMLGVPPISSKILYRLGGDDLVRMARTPADPARPSEG